MATSTGKLTLTPEQYKNVDWVQGVVHADFETYNETDELKQVHSRVAIWNYRYKIGPRTKSFWNVGLDSFMEDVLNNTRITKTYFHNVGFDFSFIVCWLLEKGYVNISTEKSKKERQLRNGRKKLKKDYFSTIDDGKLYIVAVYKYNSKKDGYKRQMTFYCTLKLLVASIEKLGNELNYQKKEIDYSRFRSFKSKEELLLNDRDLLEYLERDVEIQMISMINVFGTNSVSNATISSYTNKNISKFLYKSTEGYIQFGEYFGGMINMKVRGKYRKQFYSVLNKKEWLILKESYRGGLSIVNPLYENKLLEWKDNHLFIDGVKSQHKSKYGFGYDINSSYPSIIKNNPIPYGKIVPENKLEPGVNYLKHLRIHIIKFSKKKNITVNIIPNKNKDLTKLKTTYIDRIENDETYIISIWEDEFNSWLKIYNIDYEILDTHYLKSTNILRDYIVFLEGIKTDPKITKSDRTLVKLQLNSIYGKMGENPTRIEYLIEKLSDENANRNYIKIGYDFGYVRVPKPRDSREYRQVGTASYISALARNELVKVIMLNPKGFIYADTDSAWFIEKTIPANMIHQSKFGKWKIEHITNKAKFIKTKCYMFDDVETDKTEKLIAGAGIEVKNEMNWTNFNLKFKSDKKKTIRNNRGGKSIEYTTFQITKPGEWYIMQEHHQKIKGNK